MRIAIPMVMAAFMGVGPSAWPTGPASASSQPQQEPFRTGVDLVHLDVSVLDQNERPVPGLTMDDFIVRENGRLQRVVAFLPVEVPPPATVTAPWMRDIAPDVVSNTRETRRLVVILMDDGNTKFDQGESRIAKNVARAIVDGLGPADLASVLFTYQGRSQNFTADRQQLLAAVESFTPRHTTVEKAVVTNFLTPIALSGKPLGCLLKHGGCAVDALKNVGTFLQSAPAGRKLVFYVGSDPGLSMSGDPNNLTTAAKDMLSGLQQANIAVYAFDAAGLQTFAALGSDRKIDAAGARLAEARRSQDELKILAENTGGRAFSDTNEPEAYVSTIYRQNSSYYLLGFQSSDSRADGRFRKIDVDVNRPGVDVRTRRGYYAARNRQPKATQPAADVDAALARGIPAIDLPVQLNVATLANPGRRDASVVITAGLLQPTVVPAERVTVTAAAFDTEWKERGRYDQSFDMTAPPSGTGGLQYDTHARLALPPGRYEVRLAVESGGRTGSVLRTIDVPDFAKEELSLSSVILERQPALAIRNGVLEGILPAVPTAARTFARDEHVAVFVRLCQEGGKDPLPVSIVTRIVNERDATAFERATDLSGDEFTKDRSADRAIRLPMADLPPGEYLLRIEAVSSTRRVSQFSRFSVR